MYSATALGQQPWVADYRAVVCLSSIKPADVDEQRVGGGVWTSGWSEAQAWHCERVVTAAYQPYLSW